MCNLWRENRSALLGGPRTLRLKIRARPPPPRRAAEELLHPCLSTSFGPSKKIVILRE